MCLEYQLFDKKKMIFIIEEVKIPKFFVFGLKMKDQQPSVVPSVYVKMQLQRDTKIWNK